MVEQPKYLEMTLSQLKSYARNCTVHITISIRILFLL